MPTTANRTNWPAAIEGWLLVGIGMMVLRIIYEGQLPLYTHPRYLPLILATGVVLLLIGGARLWQTGSGIEQLGSRIGLYGLLLTPLLLGVIIPAKPAGSALIDPKQLSPTNRPYTGTNVQSGTDSRKWTLLDWMFARYTLQPSEVQGRPVDVVGFVYHAPDMAPNEWYVVRYTLVCCVADRSGASLVVHWTGNDTLSNDQWVHVVGAITERPANGPPDYVIEASNVARIPQPNEPYLYP